MLKLIDAFPENIVEALEIASKSSFQTPKNELKNIVICGLGGSGIGGKMVGQWVQNELKIPILSFQDYDIPAFIDEHTLIIASSYSGNTEETLISVEHAHEKGAHVIAICSGGQLEQFCKENGYDAIIVPGGNPPRTALAYSLVQLANIFFKLGLISGKTLEDLSKSATFLKVNKAEIQAEAKKLAEFLYGKIPVIYSTTKYEPVAIRARQQFNENSKELCWHHVIPEMNHNELVGWGGGDDRFAVLFLESNDFNPRNQKRLEFSIDVVSGKTKYVYHLNSECDSIVENSLYFTHVVDWASFYLSELNKVNSMDIQVIDRLKDTLSRF